MLNATNLDRIQTAQGWNIGRARCFLRAASRFSGPVRRFRRERSHSEQRGPVADLVPVRIPIVKSGARRTPIYIPRTSSQSGRLCSVKLRANTRCSLIPDAVWFHSEGASSGQQHGAKNKAPKLILTVILTLGTFGLRRIAA